MRITKIISFVICLAVSLVLTNELIAMYYYRDLHTSCWTFHSDDNVPDDILQIFADSAETNKVVIYTFKDKNSKDGNTQYKIYSSSSISEYLKFPLPLKLNSLSFGNLTFEENFLSDLSYIDENICFRVKGDNNNIESFISEVEKSIEIYQLNANTYPYAQQSLNLIYGLWIIVLIFLFFVSFYQVSVFKREKMIEICYGNSPILIILKSILSDFAFTIPITVASVLITKNIMSLSIDRNMILFLISIILVSALPYLSYARFNIKSISHENKLLSRLVGFSKIFKLIITTVLILVVVSATGIIHILMDSYKSNLLLKKYLDYDILNISSTDFSDVPREYIELDSILAQSYADRKVQSDLYIKYYEKCDITIIDKHYSTDDYGEYNKIYCNNNVKNYISELFAEYENTEKSDIYYFIPKNQPNEQNRIDNLDTLLSNYNNYKDYTKIIIYYDNIEMNYFDKSQDELIGTVQNPYIIYDTITPSEETLNPDTTRLDIATLVVDINDDLQNELYNYNNLKYERFNLHDNVEYRISKARNECISLFVVVALFVLLEIIMTYNIISFNYRLNTKEYCIKRALGCRILDKYKSQIIYLILVYVISAIIIGILFKSANLLPLIFISGTLMILDIISIIYFILRTEHKKVLAVLKGGLL